MDADEIAIKLLMLDSLQNSKIFLVPSTFTFFVSNGLRTDLATSTSAAR